MRDGIIKYDENINNTQYVFTKYGNSATYLGSKGVIRAAAGDLYLQEDGSSSYMPSLTYGVSSDSGNKSSWFSNLFNQDNGSRGGFAVFAEGSRHGRSFDGPGAGENDKVEAIDISGMLTPGGGNAGKFIAKTGQILNFA